MIISRTPLRMSFVGGGTDLPAFYRKSGGAVVSTAINQFVYITVNKKFDEKIRVSYSRTEEARSVDRIRHPLVREAMRLLGIAGGVEITSIADIPARGTGLGSSSAFTVGLLHALHAYAGRPATAEELARQACEIEIDRCGEPIGKQDQYAAAFGGLNFIRFNPDDTVRVEAIRCAEATWRLMEERMLVFYTGITRSASAILKEQDQKSKSDDQSMIENLHFVKDLGLQSQRALESGNLPEFARLMDVHWQRKKERSGGMSNPKINEWYDLARASGAFGGKLIGAGGGGFLMFYAEDKARLRHAMRQSGLKEVRFRFDFEGTKLVTS